MEIFPFVFYHPLESVDLCFEDSYQGFLSDLVDNVGDRAFSALPVRDVVFGEFHLIEPKRTKSIGARSGLYAGCGIRCIFLHKDIQWIALHPADMYYPSGCINP
jgi:hypothetical protein